MNLSQRNLLGKREKKKIQFCHDSNETLLPSLSAACQCCCSQSASSAVSLLSDLSSLHSCSPWGLEDDAQHFNKRHQRRSRAQVDSGGSTSPVFILCYPVNLPIVLDYEPYGAGTVVALLCKKKKSEALVFDGKAFLLVCAPGVWICFHTSKAFFSPMFWHTNQLTDVSKSPARLYCGWLLVLTSVVPWWTDLSKV